MRPAFRVSVNGSDITSKLSDRLVSLTVTDESGVKSDRVEIVLDDRDQRLAIPPTKATLTVAIGYDSGLVEKGTYVVEEVELSGPERRMVLRANATGASKGAGAARERSWDDTTIGDIAKSIASKHGWTAAVSPELASVRIEHIDQHENDLQFMSRLAADNGAVAKVTSGRLVVAPQGSGKTVSGKTVSGKVVSLSAGDVEEWSMTMAERGAYDGVKAMYHDVNGAVRGEAIAGTDGEFTHTLPHTYSTKAAAQRAAKSKLSSVQKGKARFSITSMPGDPTLTAEGRVKAQGFRSGVDGEWTLVTVVHRLTDSSYTCSLECETPAE